MTTRIWNFAPNWRSSVSHTFEFKTDIVTARSGREQRRALRTAPRRTVEFQITLPDDQRRSFARTMAVWQNKSFTLGDPVRSVATTAVLNSGTASVTAAEIPDWLTAGAAVLMENDDSRASAVVLSVNTTTRVVTFTGNAAAQWPKGTLLRPAFTGLIGTDQTSRLPAAHVAELNIGFAVDPGSETFDADEPGAHIHDGREVFIRQPNWAEPLEGSLIWPTEPVDFGFGRIATMRPVQFGTFGHQATYVSQNREQADDLTLMFIRQRGRRGEFLVPTWTDDIPLAATAAAGSSTIRTPGTDILDDYEDHPVFRAVAIIMLDGRAIYRTVESMVADGGDTVLTLDRPFNFAIIPAKVAMVCWMTVSRFASDSMTVEWLTDSVAQTSLAVQSLEYLDAENPITAYDGAAEWAYESWGAGIANTLDLLDYLVNERYPEVVG